MRWLVSAFEPFGGAKTNSSWIVLEKLRALDFGGRVEFVREPLPVTFAGAWPALKRHLSATLTGVLALGQAEGRELLNVEWVALNRADARMPDNAGAQPRAGKVRANGPDMHWSAVNWDRLTLPPLVAPSYSAGVYVCNHLFYELSEWSRETSVPSAFMHIPLLDTQPEAFAGKPRLAEGDAVQAAAAVLRELMHE